MYSLIPVYNRLQKAFVMRDGEGSQRSPYTNIKYFIQNDFTPVTDCNIRYYFHVRLPACNKAYMNDTKYSIYAFLSQQVDEFDNWLS